MKKLIQKVNQEHVIIFSVVITILTLVISSLFSWDANPIMGADKLIADLCITIFSMILIVGLGIWNSAGFQRKGFWYGMFLGSPFIVIGILAAIIGNIGIELSTLKITSYSHILLFTVNMFMVGVNEEISMRALVLNNLLSHFGESREGTKKSILISAVIFGMIHLVNLFFMSPVTVIVQAINAASAGVLFAVIFIVSKNIWSGIVTHFIVDWLSLFISQCFAGGASVLSVEMNMIQGLIMVCLGSLPPIIIASIILKKAGLKKNEG